jgi:hypothetical protein
MCGYLSQAFEHTKHMSGKMVTGKPSTWVKPGADFIPHATWDWVSHAVRSLHGGSRGQWSIVCQGGEA